VTIEGVEDLVRCRVLVVEDEIFIALFLEDLLRDLGCEVIGPASQVSEALALAAAEEPRAAVLDVNLGRERVYPVADALRQWGIPFVFVTGYGPAGLIDAYSGHPTIAKPINPATFASELVAGLRLAAARIGAASRPDARHSRR
jgi:CheY-like chemotaxis protein